MEMINGGGTLAAPNSFLYGIPLRARIDVIDKSMTHIGPDLGDSERKWWNGAMNDTGVIYCPRSYSERGILKIDTNTDTVTELNANLLPEQGASMWDSCAAALDGCIDFMPQWARRIMKLDPNNIDAISIVGDDLGGEEHKYTGTVVGIDGCVYRLPDWSYRIVKYDPINGSISFVGKVYDYFDCIGIGALRRDGCIYVITRTARVLKIDTTNNIHLLPSKCSQKDYFD